MYYAYTTNGRGQHVPVLTSPNLASWSALGDALPPVHSQVRLVHVDGGLHPVLVHGLTYGCVHGRALLSYQQRRTRPCAVGWTWLQRNWRPVGSVGDWVVGHGAPVDVMDWLPG